MKTVALVSLGLFVTSLALGQKNKRFYDTLGNETSFELHWSQVVGGRYKSVYDKKTNSKSLVRTTDKEFSEELNKTEKRIVRRDKLGIDFPDFRSLDIDGNIIEKSGLKGKVVVVNFWFVGCAPCEMERPELNGLAKIYQDNDIVKFISFARNDTNQLRSFLKDHPFLFRTIATEKDEIKNRFSVNEYPVTIIIDKYGKYFFYGSGTGIGISYILKREIESALKM